MNSAAKALRERKQQVLEFSTYLLAVGAIG